MIPNNNISNNYISTPKIQPASPKKSTKRQNILLVEDDPVMVKLLTFALEKRSFKVNTATDGKKALDFLSKSQEPNLVLLDLMLPYVNGYEVLSEIRNNSLWRDIPVIVMTAESRRKSVNEAFDAGANDYLVKPIRFDDLFVRVKSFTDFH